jgi:hypothetical protein
MLERVKASSHLTTLLMAAGFITGLHLILHLTMLLMWGLGLLNPKASALKLHVLPTSANTLMELR